MGLYYSKNTDSALLSGNTPLTRNNILLSQNNIDKNDYESRFIKVQQEGFKLFQKKNKDYGNAFEKYGSIGVLVRMGDKISRAQSISNKQITLIDTESLRDTLIDLHNYSAMAIMLLDENTNAQINTTKPNTTPKLHKNNSY